MHALLTHTKSDTLVYTELLAYLCEILRHFIVI